jgi:hypothetical protein
MTTFLIVWVVSIPAWAFGYFALQYWKVRTDSAKRRFIFAFGEIFVGSGGVGTLISLFSESAVDDVIRYSVAGFLITFGVILMLINMED